MHISYSLTKVSAFFFFAWHLFSGWNNQGFTLSTKRGISILATYEHQCFLLLPCESIWSYSLHPSARGKKLQLSMPFECDYKTLTLPTKPIRTQANGKIICAGKGDVQTELQRQRAAIMWRRTPLIASLVPETQNILLKFWFHNSFDRSKQKRQERFFFLFRLET